MQKPELHNKTFIEEFDKKKTLSKSNFNLMRPNVLNENLVIKFIRLIYKSHMHEIY